MKKITLTIIAALLFIGCQKENEPAPAKDCNCGVIANDGIDNGCYWLEIRNNCSGNKKKFCFDKDIWYNNFVGDNVCINNEPAW